MHETVFDAYRPPEGGYRGTWVGRAWLPGPDGGPAVVVVRPEGVYDISRHVATVSALLDLADPVGFLRSLPDDRRLGGVDELLADSDPAQRRADRPSLLAPIDLQAIKAAGVTFADSLLERVVEEQAKGDPARAAAIRGALVAEIGVDLSRIVPGSAEAEALRVALVARGLWSQYLEVGIGPDAEIFTKAQPGSAVGYGAGVGLHPASRWNNPEPEIVLAVSSAGAIVGATLGNDVNLRDFEGRSALLLSKAKDNNASTAIGPFLRLFDESFSLDDVRTTDLTLRVTGDDGFVVEGVSSMSRISRDPADLVAATIGREHQYPDGLMLFLGTMFVPTEPRGETGGFTHRPNDLVSIHAAPLGTLVNRVGRSDLLPEWTFGTRALIANLAARGLLAVAVTPQRQA
ncbi:fumarylacetoacetate hydrolase [Siculibacillus lacustris]|uniref:Fumarylacetoacetate hydrolase n=1 Tax=Siculibacillus lacustris TaxID=1549641 RepID=A0A4V2KU01_9HYPH|nr:fumarylacetoacetate hydrolase family protein [Siculibacillus lacustris]TBW39457.1 fumarylacetoacetate hydrolase [Siculibacillus lacustris]